MIYNKQTNENFFSLISELTSEFAKQNDTYGWSFRTDLEQIGEIKYFLITNKFYTTKLSFDPQAKYIIKTSITDVDIEKILKLKEGLQ